VFRLRRRRREEMEEEERERLREWCRLEEAVQGPTRGLHLKL